MLEPTASQWDAILATDQHVLVHAGAGTGKTATVVLKILYELGVELSGVRHSHPLKLHEIAAITYTLQAAAALKRRLRTALFEAGRADDAYEVDAARIGTIHAFTHDLLRQFSLRVGRPLPVKHDMVRQRGRRFRCPARQRE
jgi:DNA helicase-2/ATP-dependent DNA helicase PcrA